MENNRYNYRSAYLLVLVWCSLTRIKECHEHLNPDAKSPANNWTGYAIIWVWFVKQLVREELYYHWKAIKSISAYNNTERKNTSIPKSDVDDDNDDDSHDNHDKNDDD